MVRNFVTGVVLGGVVAAGGLAAVSLIAPLPQPVAGAVASLEPAAEALAQKVPEKVPENVAQPEAAKPAELPPETAPVAEDLPKPAVAPKPEPDEPLLKPLVEEAAPPPASVVPEPLPAPASTPDKVTPVAPEVNTPIALAPEARVENPARKAGADDKVPEPEGAASPETAASLQEPPLVDLPQTTAPAVPSPAPSKAAEPEIASADPAPTPTRAPDAGIADNTVEGVTTGRLPTIVPAAPAAQAAPEPAAPGLADLPPVRRFARPFDNPDGKPLFAILLIDPGTPELNRADLAALPFPVTFILDPLAEGTAEAAAIYRGAGQEVLMAATAIPPGAKASDLEQSFAGLEGRLPEAVALIETPEPRFQDDRTLAADVVTLLADQGRGLVTYDRGLNAADQVARRENLPSAMIFRSLDDDGEDSPLIRRYLDRAAFKAAQEGKVAVIGTARPETIAALLEWSVEGRSSTVALAPITALMATK